MSIRIRIISNGDERYHEIRDHETVVVVGRKDQCDIVLDEQRSSRQHFQIEKSGNGYQLVDLDSANGTRLNGKPVKKHALKLGDKIEVGSTVIWFGEPVPVKKVPTRRSAVTPSSAVRSAVPASASSSSGRRSSDVSITTIERRAEMEALRAGGLGSPRFIKNMFVAATALLVLSIGGVVMFKAMNPPPAPDSDGAMADSQSNLNDKRNASAKQQARDEFFAIADGPDDLETKIARLGKVVDKYVTEPFG
ncbi:MAG: FHA domain-containing protein, partial [Planctomycetota bacterium]